MIRSKSTSRSGCCTRRTAPFAFALIFVLAVGVIALVVSCYQSVRLNKLIDQLGVTVNDARIAPAQSALSAVQLGPSIDVRIQGSKKTISLPTNAPLSPTHQRAFRISRSRGPNVTLSPEENKVEGRVHIHYARGFGDTDSLVQLAGSTPNCYAYTPGVRWREAKPYYVNSLNTQNLSRSFIVDNFRTAVETWNSQLSRPIFGEFIDEEPGQTDLDIYDGINTFNFGTILNPGVIAITITWGIFTGPRQDRKIFEFDMVFNQDDYLWEDAMRTRGVMDLLNFCTHEVGHAAGEADVQGSLCTEATMYAYGSIGEVKKRTLSTPDLLGLGELYDERIIQPPPPSRQRNGASRYSTTLFVLVLLLYAIL